MTRMRSKSIAVVDLGSNSLKMVCYEKDRTGVYRPYRRESKKMRLDEYGSKVINEDALSELIPTLIMYRNILQYEGVSKVCAVATSAVRDAANRGSLLDTISRESGFDFVVISGVEEALCSYAGAATQLNIPSSIMFDLGGGSLEFVSSRNHTILKTLSLPLGALVLTRKFAGDSDFNEQSVKRLREYLRDILPDPRILDSRRNQATLVGVGGAMRTLARYIQNHADYPLKKLHNYTIEPSAIHDTTETLLSIDRSELADMYEVGRGRADIIKAGAIVISEIVSMYSSKEITVSSVGLREGVLALASRYPAFNHNFISDYHVRELVRPPRSRKRIPAGASDVVHFISSSRLLSHEEFRMLLAAATNIESLQTFRDADDFVYRAIDQPSMLSHRVQLLVALSLSYSKKPKRTVLLLDRYSGILCPGDQKIMVKLAPILALCELIMTAEAGVDMNIQDGVIKMHILNPVRSIPHTILQRACTRMGGVLGVPVRVV